MSRDTDDVIGPLTSKASNFKQWFLNSNSGCSCARAINLFLFLSNLGQESHSTIAQLTFTNDLETEGHVMIYMTFVISAYIRLAAIIFLFVRFPDQGNHSITIANCMIFTSDREN